ncbi:kinase-like domain-containing protein [Lentinula edodes]|uniref:kinase-like domain-containing protein n=1 Tax=Lentinula edodes TaxID=5353 RepID=UPI001E8DEC20|nr:kinase-like domain-containing protein [Lentinula edodes]KAH7873216.1 kinase-like domain-containing protein [Lentinula edodes]KAJ3910675.1 kinase-like domain-containing protein [Lentinula edodes]
MASTDNFGNGGADNYEIIEEISTSAACYVYRARCKRGRLKNRIIALKKVPVERSHSPSSLSLYQTLCHPSIVSLFSAFATSNHRFQVLELCSGGSLASFLRTHEHCSLSEGQTRSVIKAILDGLTYLKNNSIVHRNISPENVLLTEHCRIKISNLDLATRLPSQDHTAIVLLTRAEYIAPEFLSRRSYDYRADIWSLGCLVFTCLVGKPPFQGPSMDDMFENILHGRFSTPESISTLARNFISNLILVDPMVRLDLSSIFVDPFLDSRLPEIPLKFSNPDLPSGHIKTLKPHPIPFRAPSSLKTKVSMHSTHKNDRPPLRDIQNSDLRRILSDEISFGDRRAVSDPSKKSGTIVDYGSRRHSSLNLPIHVRPQVLDRAEISESSDSSEHEHEGVEPHNIVKEAVSDSLPIGTSRPSALTTNLLSAQAHKTINGQITILPSRSLLVDFREGERRRSNPGTEVFVVSPDGNQISIFSAPHLSIPCCLTEPISTYTIKTLPREYWVQYNNAGSLIGRLKQRTPRMTVHEPSSKCTLMANTPQADIELLLADSLTSKVPQKQSGVTLDSDRPQIRLRYSRQMHSLEISQCVTGPQGKEWKKRTLRISSLDPVIEPALLKFTNAEAEGLSRLSKFLRVCVSLEEEETIYGQEHDTTVLARSSESDLVANSLVSKNPHITNRVASSSRTLAQSFSVSSVDLKLAPRPPKFSSMSKRLTQDDQELEDIFTPSEKEFQEIDYSTKALSLTASDITPSWYRNGFCSTELIASTQPLQTRYIPSAGWCIRYNSKVSQGGRYKVMFLDGEILDIDVDEEWVEHIVPDLDDTGKKQRCSIRESHSKRALSERMKVFEEFVSMFDAENSSLQP